MRIVVALGLLCFATAPCLAQDVTPTFLKREPYFLPPSSVVFVDSGTCGVGKVMKITGALGAMRRKKTCVSMGREEASRTFATP